MYVQCKLTVNVKNIMPNIVIDSGGKNIGVITRKLRGSSSP